MRLLSLKIHPLVMAISRQVLRSSRGPVFAALLLVPTLAQQAGKPISPVDPIPQDTGAAGLKQMLTRLQTTARLMQTVAHPDDEDGGMLTLESRGKGVSTVLFTLTRGEGGQNRLGSNLFDVLGVLRTLELTASDRYYGVEQRFSRVADFGFSKSADETFQKWQGHDVALADMVRVIREFRPDVLIARFSGTERDGHGHHQVSALLAREAFRAAADPKRFPEQIAENLLPWQVKKLYIGNVCGFGATTCPAENYTVRLNTGDFSPTLGMSYVQFAVNEGLRHQLSQGAGGWSVEPGDRFAFYKLVDSALPPTTDKDGHEKDFFDGIDTSLPGLASRLGAEADVPFLRPALREIAEKIKAASGASDHPDKASLPLLAALALLDSLVEHIEETDLGNAKPDILTTLRDKQQQCAAAANLALGLSLSATVAPPNGPGSRTPSENEALTTLSPGETAMVIAKFHNGSKQLLQVEDVELEAPEGFTVKTYKSDIRVLQPGEDFYANFRIQVPANVKYTRPHWHRTDPETESVNTIDDRRLQTLPFPPPSLSVSLRYAVQESRDSSLGLLGIPLKRGRTTVPQGRISVPVVTEFRDEQGAVRKRTVAIAPVFSVMLEPGGQVVPVANGKATTVKVAVSSNLAGAREGQLHLEVPAGWRVEPSELPVEFHRRGEKQEFEFKVFPASLKEGRAEIRAVLESDRVKYSEGYSVVTREDLDTFYYYQPAVQRVSIVDVKVPNDLKVGYIMGAGDDIPTVLQQIGMDVSLIPAEKVASEDLSHFGTIVLGIRAYDTQKEVVSTNQKLLEYVSNGGTLLVQYNTGVGDFNSGKLTPYPAQLSRARVSVEDAPVEILAPDDSVFHHPNAITQRDFDGWVQERGLYFMGQWDGKFQPLLACNDPGEQPQKGGLLRAQYGKGTYIYTGYAFFRQLPAGVPGAIRLYVNLLSAGHERSR